MGWARPASRCLARLFVCVCLASAIDAACTYFRLENGIQRCSDSPGNPGATALQSSDACMAAALELMLTPKTRCIEESDTQYPSGCYLALMNNNQPYFNTKLTSRGVCATDTVCLCALGCYTTTPATDAPPTDAPPTAVPTDAPPTTVPDTAAPPTDAPPTSVPTAIPDTATPTDAPTAVPDTAAPPTSVPDTAAPTAAPVVTPAPPGAVLPTPAPPTALPAGTTAAPDATEAPGDGVTHISYEGTARMFRDGLPQVANGAMTGAGIAGALAAGGSTAATASVLLVVSSAECTSYEAELPFPLHPTQMTVMGSKNLGAVAGNVLVIAVATLVSYASINLLMRCKIPVWGLDDPRGFLRFPSATLFIALWLYMGSIIGSFRVVITPVEYQQERHNFMAVVGCVSLFILLLLPLWLLHHLRKHVHRYDNEGKAYYQYDTRPLPRWMTFIVGPGEWVSSKRECVFALRFQTMLRPFTQRCCYFVFYDFLLVAVVGILSVLNSKNWKTCALVRLLSALANLAAFGLELWFFPHARPRDNYTTMALKMLQAIGLLLMSWGFFSEDPGHGAFQVASVVFLVCLVMLMVKLVLDLITETWVLFTSRRPRLEDLAWGKHQQKEDEARADRLLAGLDGDELLRRSLTDYGSDADDDDDDGALSLYAKDSPSAFGRGGGGPRVVGGNLPELRRPISQFACAAIVPSRVRALSKTYSGNSAVDSLLSPGVPLSAPRRRGTPATPALSAPLVGDHPAGGGGGPQPPIIPPSRGRSPSGVDPLEVSQAQSAFLADAAKILEEVEKIGTLGGALGRGRGGGGGGGGGGSQAGSAAGSRSASRQSVLTPTPTRRTRGGRTPVALQDVVRKPRRRGGSRAASAASNDGDRTMPMLLATAPALGAPFSPKSRRGSNGSTVGGAARATPGSLGEGRLSRTPTTSSDKTPSPNSLDHVSRGLAAQARDHLIANARRSSAPGTPGTPQLPMSAAWEENSP